MNEAIIAQHAKAHKLITDSLGLPSLDEENERRYNEDSFRKFKVPVEIIRRGCVEIMAQDAQSAENVVSVCASLCDDLENAEQSEKIGQAVEV